LLGAAACCVAFGAGRTGIGLLPLRRRLLARIVAPGLRRRRGGLGRNTGVALQRLAGRAGAQASHRLLLLQRCDQRVVNAEIVDREPLGREITAQRALRRIAHDAVAVAGIAANAGQLGLCRTHEIGGPLGRFRGERVQRCQRRRLDALAGNGLDELGHVVDACAGASLGLQRGELVALLLARRLGCGRGRSLLPLSFSGLRRALTLRAQLCGFGRGKLLRGQVGLGLGLGGLPGRFVGLCPLGGLGRLRLALVLRALLSRRNFRGLAVGGFLGEAVLLGAILRGLDQRVDPVLRRDRQRRIRIALDEVLQHVLIA